jgi:hypothetical protein
MHRVKTKSMTTRTKAMGMTMLGIPRATSLELTSQSLKNLGLTAEYLRPIELSNFYRTVTFQRLLSLSLVEPTSKFRLP